MVSLSLTPQHKFDQVKRNDLFYGQFCYSARFYLKEASALRELNHESVDLTLNKRSNWGNKTITSDDRKNVHETCATLLGLQNPYKTMISMNWLYFYTNNLSDIDSLCANTPMEKLGHVSEVVITHPKNTIGLKNPKHAYRTYVRSHRPTDQQKESLREFVKHNKKFIKISQGLRNFLKAKQPRYYMSDYYFIDHNDMKMVTALALMNPGLVRKTMPIVQINS